MSRTPHRVWEALATPQVLTGAIVGDASGDDFTPSRSTVPAGTPLTVDAHLVEHGDVLFGLRTPIASILTDGAWWYYGAEGTIIARRRCGARVQVVRPADLAADVEMFGRDWFLNWADVRPLRLVP